MRIVIICMLGLLLVGCGGTAVDLPTETPAPPAAPAEPLPLPTAMPPTAVPVAGLIAEGDALAEQGKLEEAIRVYKQAVSQDHENAEAHNALGIAYNESGMFDLAEFELLEAIRIDPENGIVHSNLCKNYAEQAKIEQALAECLEAIRLSPDVAQAHVNLGLVYSRQDNLDLALQEFQEAIRLDPEIAVAHYDLGAVYAKLGRPEEAKAAFQEAVRLDPDYTAAHFNLGNAYHALDQMEQALAEWQRAVELDPEYADAHLNLGVAYKQLGRNEQALVELQTYLDLVPDSPQREAVESDIASLRAPQAELAGQYVSVFGGYQVNHPADWTAHAQDEPGMILLGADVADPNPLVLILTRALSFIASKLDLEEIDTLSEFAAAVAPQYGIDPQALESATVSGVPALAGVWSGTNTDPGMPGRISFLVNDGMGYIIVYSATPDQLAAFEPTAQAMLASLTFVEPPVTVPYANPTAGYELLYPEGWVVDPEDGLVQFTPLPDMTPADGPAVALFAGQDNIAGTFQVEGELSTESIIDAFATLAEARLGDRGAVDLGGEPTTLVEVQAEIDGVPVAGILIVWDPATRPLVALGLAPASQWGPVSDTFVTMMQSLAFAAAAAEPSTVDFTDPAAVVQAVFDAAASQDFSVLSSLCDPLGENDEDTAMICAITDSHASRDSFVEYFAKGKLVDEGEIHAGRYEVPFLFGPNGDQQELMILIQRDGKWYLFSF